MMKRKVKKVLKRRKRIVLRKYLDLRKRVFPIPSKNPLAVAPVKKVKSEK